MNIKNAAEEIKEAKGIIPHDIIKSKLNLNAKAFIPNKKIVIPAALIADVPAEDNKENTPTMEAIEKPRTRYDPIMT